MGVCFVPELVFSYGSLELETRSQNMEEDRGIEIVHTDPLLSQVRM